MWVCVRVGIMCTHTTGINFKSYFSTPYRVLGYKNSPSDITYMIYVKTFTLTFQSIDSIMILTLLTR